MLRGITAGIQSLFAVTAIANVADVAGSGEAELITWLIRGSLSVALLLLVWLFQQAVGVLKVLREDSDDNSDRILAIEIHLGIDERLENHGIAARRRRGRLQSPHHHQPE